MSEMSEGLARTLFATHFPEQGVEGWDGLEGEGGEWWRDRCLRDATTVLASPAVTRIRADAAAAARTEVVEAVEALLASEIERLGGPGAVTIDASPLLNNWIGGIRTARDAAALTPPVDHAHAADGTEVGA